MALIRRAYEGIGRATCSSSSSADAGCSRETLHRTTLRSRRRRYERQSSALTTRATAQRAERSRALRRHHRRLSTERSTSIDSEQGRPAGHAGLPRSALRDPAEGRGQQAQREHGRHWDRCCCSRVEQSKCDCQGSSRADVGRQPAGACDCSSARRRRISLHTAAQIGRRATRARTRTTC